MSLTIPTKQRASDFPEQGLAPTREQIIHHLRHAGVVAERAMLMGRQPFGAILV